MIDWEITTQPMWKFLFGTALNQCPFLPSVLRLLSSVEPDRGAGQPQVPAGRSVGKPAGKGHLCTGDPFPRLFGGAGMRSGMFLPKHSNVSEVLKVLLNHVSSVRRVDLCY